MKGCPSWFQQCIVHKVLKDLLYEICELNFDDVIVFGATEAEFLANVEKIFSRLDQSSAALYAIGIAPICKHVDGLAKGNCADGGFANAYVDDCNISSSDQGILSSLDYFDVFVDDGTHMNMQAYGVSVFMNVVSFRRTYLYT